MARDLACAALGWALAAAFWFGATRLQRSLLSDEFGADGLPKGLAVLLAIVSGLIAVRALLRVRHPAPRDKEAGPGLAAHAKALAIIAIGFGYVFLAPWIGYLPAIALIIFVTGLHYGARASLTLALVSAGGAALLWLVFAYMLSVSMPPGFWAGIRG